MNLHDPKTRKRVLVAFAAAAVAVAVLYLHRKGSLGAGTAAQPLNDPNIDPATGIPYALEGGAGAGSIGVGDPGGGIVAVDPGPDVVATPPAGTAGGPILVPPPKPGGPKLPDPRRRHRRRDHHRHPASGAHHRKRRGHVAAAGGGGGGRRLLQAVAPARSYSEPPARSYTRQPGAILGGVRHKRRLVNPHHPPGHQPQNTDRRRHVVPAAGRRLRFT